MTLMLFFIGMGIAKASTATSLLMPKPHELTENGASFDLNRTVSLDDPTGSSLLASLFTTGSGTASVTVNIVSAATLGTFDYTLAGFDNEGYKLNVTTNDITITAASKTGVIRAAQTLMQLKAATDGAYIPGVEITDYPAFKLRGYMHDVGRSFISFAELKKEIDLLSRFKVNVFHWHLTDNQGFRFESQQYPQLNQASNMTRFAGSYYTQAQCTELEAYAAERGVIVIPEIDMPGHSTAFTNAMGFTMSSDDGKAALKVLLGELASAFPLAPYIHMGADEAGTTAAFVNEMSQYIKETLGRKCIVWNPISGVTINTTNLPYIDMTEMWSTSGTKITGLPNIDCRYNYINHFDVFADLVGIYKSNVYYASQGSAEVAGAITAIWNDRKTATETDIISQNGLYANALATAERGWMGGGNQYIEVGGTTLPNSGTEFEEFVDWERRFLHYKDTWLAGEPIPYVKQTNVKWRITQPFPNGGTASAVFPPEQSTDEVLPDEFTYNNATYTTSMATGAGIYLRHVWGTTVPAFFSSPTLNTTAYAWTYVYSPTAQTAGALIEFQNYSRSENDKAPDAGNWDRKGSRIWVNGTEVTPPTWTNSGVSINSEVDLGNENFPARAPISISLQQGWNKVFLKLPYVNASNIRLNKWMFTFVLTDAAGRNALDNIVYSPIQSLDENVEGVVALIGEVKSYVNEMCGTAIGYYPVSLASTLMAKVSEIEATLQSVLTAQQRTAQETELQTAFDTFKSSLSSQQINQPLVSTSTTTHYYTLCTPLRGTRYVTATGTSSELGGTSALSDLSYWKFVERTDGTFDIVNGLNGSYIAPNSTNNSALMTQTSQPSAGWTVGKAATAGYVSITSGTCQFNQTNKSSSVLSGGYRVFNWGDGTNTTDTGCQYLIEEVDVNLDEEEESDGTKVLNVGSQVTSESDITSGKVYILKTGADRYITDNGTNYDVPNSANSATEASAYYLISNGDGTWKIKNYYTGKYWGVPVYNTALTSVAEASAGAWSLNFSSGVAYPSCPDANTTVRGIDRSSGKVWGWSTGTNNNHKVYIYEVPLSSTAAFEAFGDKEFAVASEPVATVSKGTWYVMSQRSRTTYLFEDVSTHTLKHTQTKPSGLATANANYLVRLVTGSDGNYYIQNGLGNYMGQITASTNVPTTALKEQQHVVAKIGATSGHYYVQCASNNVLLDANDFSQGDPSTVVGWGTTVPTATGGNNDWAFYPVTFAEPWTPTASEVYTINNPLTNRGAMMYNGSSDYVWSSGKSGTFDASDNNCLWVIYPTATDGQYYLYNVGAAKFAIPSGTASEASWVFSSDAVAVTLILQNDGTYKIKTAVTDTYAAVSNSKAGPIINYNDEGGNFVITQVENADQSVAVSAALGKLVDNVTPLSAVPAAGTDGWYVIRIKTHGTYADKYVYPANPEITYNSTAYALTFDHGCNIRPAIDDVTYYTRIFREEGTVYWQMPNGKYLYGNNSKFPVPTFTQSSFSMDYTADKGFRMWGSSRYAVPYLLGSQYFIGETSNSGNAYYDIYPVNLDEAGLVAWQVVVANAGNGTQLTCTRSDVCGQTSVYNGGWFFLPSGVTPATTDFEMEGMVGTPAVDTDAKTVTVTYNPAVCLLPDDVTIIQGNQTTGKGNTMQPLLRIKATPFAACTPTQFSITLTGADQLDKVAVYTTAIDEIMAEGANPQKIGEMAASEGTLSIDVNAAEQGANASLYYWVVADVKSTATEWAAVDASIQGIAYSNASGSDVCDLTAKGDPDGEMRIYKQQTALWTPSHANTTYYRIPTILNTGTNGIVALTDYRHGHPYDLGKNANNGSGAHVIDVVARRSTDGGLTWEPEVTVAAGDGVNAATYGFGDPAIVADADGTLHCLMAAGSASYASGMLHMGYSKSTDNGASWSAVTDIYSSIDKGGLEIASAFTTGGKGVTFPNGRMAFAFLGKVGGTTNIYPLYSDDKGATWHVQPTVAYGGGDESKFEIMNDNSLLLSVRKGSYNGTAVRSYNRTTGDASGDGIGSWGTASNWGSEMNANGCNADILYYSRSVNGERDVLLHTLTKSYSTYRKDLRLYMSLDQGETWKEIFQLQPGYAAYSSMQKLANGDLAVIYEDGSIGNQDKQDCYAINYVVISKELLEEKIDEQYDASQCPTVTITDQGVTNGSAPYGTWSPASGWANTFTSNATSGLAGVVVSADYNAFNRESDYGQRVFCLKPSAAGATDIITLTAPDGYVIDGYSVGGRYYTGSETYTLTAEDGTSVAVNLGASGTPGYLTTGGLNAKSTTITFSNSNSSNSRYACLTHFTVTLRAATDIALTACGGRSYATLFLSDGVTMTEDVIAYKISLNGEWAVPVELGQEIPASTPVMLCSETAKTSAKAIYNGSATADVGGNLLAGNSVKQHVDGYVLNIVEGVPGFYKLSASGKLNANRAYLPTSVVTGNVKGFAFNWDIEDGMETTVPGVQSLDKAVYDLSGRRIEKPTRGVYIVNGKKVVVK